jgi:predicted Zn-dependent protease
VLGHEIGHVAARHSVRQYTKQSAGQLGLLTLGIFVPSTYPFSGLAGSALGVAFLKYSRDDEVEADGLGVRYATEAGWDPHGIANMLTTLSRLDQVTDRRGIPNWLSTHPQPDARVERVSSKVQEAIGTKKDLQTNRDDYLRRLDGMIFGDNPDEGIVRDNVFVHPSMRLSLAFPLDWPINNGQEQVVAKNPSADQYMLLQEIEHPQGRSLEDAAERQMSKMGWKPRSHHATKVNGLDAVAGIYDGSVSKLGNVTADVLHVALGRKVFLVAGVAKREQFAEADKLFAPALQTFRELTAHEASALQPNVIALYTTKAGDSWQSIAAKNGYVIRSSTLAIMNGHAVNDQPAPDEKIKIVVGGQ